MERKKLELSRQTKIDSISLKDSFKLIELFKWIQVRLTVCKVLLFSSLRLDNSIMIEMNRCKLANESVTAAKLVTVAPTTVCVTNVTM